jgi:hypothetical protein
LDDTPGGRTLSGALTDAMTGPEARGAWEEGARMLVDDGAAAEPHPVIAINATDKNATTRLVGWRTARAVNEGASMVRLHSSRASIEKVGASLRMRFRR